MTVFDALFQKRDTYLQTVLAFLSSFRQERCIVFLDPDTGLEPGNPTLEHVLDKEAWAIWEAMKAGDVFAFYQHRAREAGDRWFEPKRRQLAKALCIQAEAVKIANGPSIVRDVVIFYTQRPDRPVTSEAGAQATIVSVRQRPTTPKKEKALKPCACGCPLMTALKFYPGHDAKYKSKVLKVERGEMKIEELPRSCGNNSSGQRQKTV